MASRAQSITVSYVAWDTVNNVGKTGDVANHTLKFIKDGTAATPTNSPAEVDATNAPGVYKLVLTSTECTCDSGTLAGKSSTTGVSIIPISVTFEQLPTAAPAAANGLITFGTGSGQITASSGLVSLSGTQTFNVTGNITGNLSGSVGSVTGAVGSVTANVTLAATPPTAAAIFTAVLTTQLTEAYAAVGTAPTLAQAVFLVMQALTEFSVASTTVTSRKLDRSTTASTYTLDSSTSPTSRTRAS